MSGIVDDARILPSSEGKSSTRSLLIVLIVLIVSIDDNDDDDDDDDDDVDYNRLEELDLSKIYLARS